jgi:hypothetical protein
MEIHEFCMFSLPCLPSPFVFGEDFDSCTSPVGSQGGKTLSVLPPDDHSSSGIDRRQFKAEVEVPPPTFLVYMSNSCFYRFKAKNEPYDVEKRLT